MGLDYTSIYIILPRFERICPRIRPVLPVTFGCPVNSLHSLFFKIKDMAMSHNTRDAPNRREIMMIILNAPRITLPNVKLVMPLLSLPCHIDHIINLVRRI